MMFESPEPSERVIYHELGHLIVGRALGEIASSITVEPRQLEDGRWINGRVSREQTGSNQDSFEYRFRRLIILAAGAAAEGLFFGGECKSLRGSDATKSRKHAGAFCDTEMGIDHLLRAAAAEAEGILIENAFLVVALVEHLRASGTMTGAEVEACISDAEAKKLAASWQRSGYIGNDTVADIRARMMARQNLMERLCSAV
jgi:hypothetical protein